MKKTALITIAILALFILFFTSLSDLTKARVSLKTLGIQKQKTEQFSKSVNILLEGGFHKYTNTDQLDTALQLKIERSFNNGRVATDSFYFEFSDIFANEGEKWFSSCMFTTPLYKLEYILHSENSLIICAMHGGFASGYHTSFYKISPQTLVLVGSFQSSTSLFDLALRMKYDKDLIDWSSDDGDILIGKSTEQHF